jgi:hypothetical protein
MPIMARTLVTAPPASGKKWELNAYTPSAATIEEIASSSGTPASRSDPNTMNRIARVIGRVNRSTWPSWVPSWSFSSLDIDLPPVCANSRSGCDSCTAAVVSSSGSTWSAASCAGMDMVTASMRASPLSAVTGSVTSATSSRAPMRVRRSAAAAAAASGSRSPVGEEMRICSTAGASRPCSSAMVSASPASPIQ